MSLEIFQQSLAFTEKFDMPAVMLSGGEPLEHPLFFSFAEMVISRGWILSILSNGMFLEDKEVREQVIELDSKGGVLIQITNDSRFYPKRIVKWEHPLLGYEDHIESIVPLGRAKRNKIPATRYSPMCFNLRSVVRNRGNFQEGLRIIRQSKHFCTPSIDVDGTIRAGESNQCFSIGTVRSSDVELTKNLCTMKCNLCGLEDNLFSIARQALGLEDVEKSIP